MEATHERFKQSLITAFEEILDKMVFMVFEPGSKADLQPAEFAYTSQISFGGRLSGTMSVFLTRATAEEFARNLIGIRQGDTLHNATLEDALREFCNILMGRTLSLMAPEEHFDLQLPVTHAGAVSSGADRVTLAVDGVLNEVEPCRIEVSLNPATP